MDKLKRYRGLCHFIEGEYKFIEQLKEMEVFADTTEYQQQSYKRIEEWEQERQQIDERKARNGQDTGLCITFFILRE